MHSTSEHRLFQGIRRSEAGHRHDTPDYPSTSAITLDEIFSPQTHTESIIISVQAPSVVNFCFLSNDFRKAWKMIRLAVIGSRDHEILDVPFYSETTFKIELASLDQYTAHRVRYQYDGQSGDLFIREEIVYTACFVRRTEACVMDGVFARFQIRRTTDAGSGTGAPAEDPLACLSLTNNNDIAFVFPFEGTSAPRILWGNKVKLSEASSYFAAMFSSGFQESGNSFAEVSKLFAALKQDLNTIAATEGAKEAREGPSVDDSDDEMADTAAEQDEMQSVGGQDGAGTLHYVAIRDTPYKTYRALFQWFETRKITFSTLKSGSLQPSKPTLRASPKSVYRLCHQLGIEDLKAVALTNFETQLSPTNVLDELFSNNCFNYPELRTAALRVLEKNWAAVKAKGGLDALLESVNREDGDNREMMRVAIDILRRL